MKIANRSSVNVATFKLLGMTVTNQYLIHDESKNILNSGKVCTMREVVTFLRPFNLPERE
jgi:hypothetical protein